MKRLFRKRLALSLSMALVFALQASLVLAQDAQNASWPVFRGLKGDGKSPDTGLLKSWPDGGPTLLWTADFIGHGYSGVTVDDGRIFTSGNIEKEDKTLAMVFCLDMNGKLLWQNDNGPGLAERRRYPSTRGTPTIDGDRVYDESAIGQISCLNVKTGEKIWTRNVIKDYGAGIPEWYLGESVVIDGNNLICTPGGPKVSAVALDKKTGRTVWEAASAKEMAGYSTPYFFEHEGMRLVLIQTEHTAEGIEAATGKTLFSFPWLNFRDTNVPMPIYRNGTLFMTSGYGFGAKLYRLGKPENGKIKVDEVWHEKSFDNHHGGVILVGDYVYGTTHKGSWASINYDTGKIGYMVRAIGAGSITFADGLIYGLAEDDKTVILLKPEPEKFVEISRFELPNEAEGKSWAHPVVIGSRLYIRHSQYLYCYDVKAP